MALIIIVFLFASFKVRFLSRIVCRLEELCAPQSQLERVFSEGAEGVLDQFVFLDFSTYQRIFYFRDKDLGNQEKVTIGPLKRNPSTCSRMKRVNEGVRAAIGRS